mmetsp:Transcript_8806/g.26384  ORF Transcript_8806/g.26384 Transcript_8806/m.26384 type:complete len:629 (-) Transcript_8806:91-1977(-)
MSTKQQESAPSGTCDDSPEVGVGKAETANTAVTLAATDVAVASPEIRSDATIAQALQAVEQLTSVFGFDMEVASDAVSHVGPDVTAAYNWILDTGAGEDHGGPIIPRIDCPHISLHMRVTPDMLCIEQPCGHFREEGEGSDRGVGKGCAKDVTDAEGSCPQGENWICLECGATRCSRYVNGHALSHWEMTRELALKKKNQGVEDGNDGAGHCIAVSLADLSVWCYECNAYLKHPKLSNVTKHLENLKFGSEDEVRRPLHDVQEKSGESGSVADDISDSSEDIPPGAALYGGVPVPPLMTIKLPTSLEGMAKFILSPECKSVVILAGAGMSVSSGIPDFRSAGGMYETLRPDLLTATDEERFAMEMDPTTVFEKGMFLQNPLPCLELKRSFILGTQANTWKATLAHRFVELLHKKTGKLTRLYTQNIDGLEGQCGNLPREKVVSVHGSMDRAACELCGAETDFNTFCDDVRSRIKDITGQDSGAPTESKPIQCKTCSQPAVKPTIVLFRSSLPEEFYTLSKEDLPGVDLLIVVGTSLTVAPANSLVYRVPPHALRMVVNNEPVGFRLGIQYGSESTRDFFAKGFCDEVFLDLMCHLGWMSDLKGILENLPEASAELLRNRLACMDLDEE